MKKILLTIFSLFLFCAVAHAEIHYSADRVFSIDVPDGWSHVNFGSDGSDIEVLSIRNNNTGDLISFRVTRGQMPMANYDVLTDYQRENIKNAKKQMQIQKLVMSGHEVRKATVEYFSEFPHKSIKSRYIIKCRGTVSMFEEESWVKNYTEYKLMRQVFYYGNHEEFKTRDGDVFSVSLDLKINDKLFAVWAYAD